MNATTTPYRSMAGWTLALWVVLAVIADKAPEFVYDARQYWLGAQAVLEGRNVYLQGGLAARGAFTSVIYLPAFLVSRALGGSVTAEGWAVAGQNALFVAVVGAVVVPMLLRRVVEIRSRHVALSSVLTGVLLAGFVPYPLMDLAALLAVLLAVLLLCARRWWAALLGGASLALAANLRPAYVVPAVLVLLVVVATDWRRTPLAALGGAVVLGTQAVYASAQSGVTSVLPPAARLVTEIQLAYASYVVRYDTVPYTGGDPRMWHCDPSMARAVGTRTPASSTDLLGLFVDTLPRSALFSLEKVAANLHWSSGTPYAHPGEQAFRPLGLLVIALTCIGLVALVPLSRGRLADRAPVLAVLALALGGLVTIVGSTPEARFALPAVLAAVVGTVGAVARWWHRDVLPTRGFRVAGAAAVLLAVLVAGVGWLGLQHDLPPDDPAIGTCRTA